MLDTLCHAVTLTLDLTLNCYSPSGVTRLNLSEIQQSAAELLTI